MSERISSRETMRRSCHSLYAGENMHTDTQKRTRASQKGQGGTIYSKICRELALLHNDAYIPKHIRPAFSKATVDLIYQSAKSRSISDGKNTVGLYECTVFSGQSVYLPKKADLTKAQVIDSSINDFATIGHIRQWREHIVNNADAKRFVVNIDLRDYEVYAYSKEDVMRLYNDPDNLRLEGQSFNSSVAYSYDQSDDPLMPTFKAL